MWDPWKPSEADNEPGAMQGRPAMGHKDGAAARAVGVHLMGGFIWLVQCELSPGSLCLCLLSPGIRLLLRSEYSGFALDRKYSLRLRYKRPMPEGGLLWGVLRHCLEVGEVVQLHL